MHHYCYLSPFKTPKSYYSYELLLLLLLIHLDLTIHLPKLNRHSRTLVALNQLEQPVTTTIII